MQVFPALFSFYSHRGSKMKKEAVLSGFSSCQPYDEGRFNGQVSGDCGAYGSLKFYGVTIRLRTAPMRLKS